MHFARWLQFLRVLCQCVSKGCVCLALCGRILVPKSNEMCFCIPLIPERCWPNLFSPVAVTVRCCSQGICSSKLSDWLGILFIFLHVFRFGGTWANQAWHQSHLLPQTGSVSICLIFCVVILVICAVFSCVFTSWSTVFRYSYDCSAAFPSVIGTVMIVVTGLPERLWKRLDVWKLFRVSLLENSWKRLWALLQWRVVVVQRRLLVVQRRLLMGAFLSFFFVFFCFSA